MIHDLEPILREHPFFDGLPSELLTLMVGCARNVRFDGDEVIFRQGEPADVFYLLRAGRVALEVHDPARGKQVVQTLEPGDVVGWSCFFAPHRWAWTARSMEASRALAMDARCLRRKFDDDPALGYDFMQRVGRALADRLHATRIQMLDLFHHGERVG